MLRHNCFYKSFVKNHGTKLLRNSILLDTNHSHSQKDSIMSSNGFQHLAFLILLVVQICFSNAFFVPDELQKKTSLGVTVDQFYFHDHSHHTYIPANAPNKNLKEHGYTYLFELEGTLVQKNPRGHFKFFSGLTTGFGTGNYKDIEEEGNVYFVSSPREHPNFLFNSDFQIGLTSTVDHFFLSLFSGLEYDFKRIEHSFTNEIYQFKDAVYTMIDLPLGIQFDYAVHQNLVIGVSFINKFMLYGKSESTERHKSPFLSTGEKDLAFPETRLVNKYGFGVKLPIQVKLGETLRLRLTPWFDYRPFEEDTYELAVLHMGQYIIDNIGSVDSKQYQIGLSLSTMFFRKVKDKVDISNKSIGLKHQ